MNFNRHSCLLVSAQWSFDAEVTLDVRAQREQSHVLAECMDSSGAACKHAAGPTCMNTCIRANVVAPQVINTQPWRKLPAWHLRFMWPLQSSR